MIDVIFSAASQAAPGRVVANAYGTINALSLAGKRANGQRWVMFSFFGGGHGGSIEGDGLNHGNAPISTATIPPMEILEAAYPVMFRQWALRPDSAGAGRASRRPRRGLRDRTARGKRRGVPLRGARPLPAARACPAARRGR
jgi:N-methylhydantoinase B